MKNYEKLRNFAENREILTENREILMKNHEKLMKKREILPKNREIANGTRLLAHRKNTGVPLAEFSRTPLSGALKNALKTPGRGWDHFPVLDAIP